LRPLIRFLLDAFYVFCLFTITLIVAAGASLLATYFQSIGVDPAIVWMVHQVERVLVGLDCLGVVLAGGFQLYRFVRMLFDDAH
jgi:hypothetical protein